MNPTGGAMQSALELCNQPWRTARLGVAESGYETIAESLEALSKILQNHSIIQQRWLKICPNEPYSWSHEYAYGYSSADSFSKFPFSHFRY
jgi:hypothetical protein